MQEKFMGQQPEYCVTSNDRVCNDSWDISIDLFLTVMTHEVYHFQYFSQ